MQVVLCDDQWQGRGRQGKVWEAKAHASLTMSLAIHSDQFNLAALPWIPLASGTALWVALAKSGVRNIGRWPLSGLTIWVPTRDNSFLKVAGVLVEFRQRVLVVGWGVNLLSPNRARSSLRDLGDFLLRFRPSWPPIGVSEKSLQRYWGQLF